MEMAEIKTEREYDGKKYLLFDREVEADGKKYHKVFYAEDTRRKDGWKQLSKVPTESFYEALHGVRPITISDNEKAPPWHCIQYVFSKDDKKKLRDVAKARERERIRKEILAEGKEGARERAKKARLAERAAADAQLKLARENHRRVFAKPLSAYI
jgi:hypothetical protein